MMSGAGGGTLSPDHLKITIDERSNPFASAWGFELAPLLAARVVNAAGAWADPVAAFTWHRGYSHSVVCLTLVAPLFAWLLARQRPDGGVQYMLRNGQTSPALTAAFNGGVK